MDIREGQGAYVQMHVHVCTESKGQLLSVINFGGGSGGEVYMCFESGISIEPAKICQLD